VRKTLASLFLGAALLVPCGSALSETPRPPEPRWGIRPEKSAPALLDFARWLSERLRGIATPAATDPAPTPLPVWNPNPEPNLDVICPSREHCPIG
jgi:hypothetical protein